jgi:hypothetical protein
LKQRRNSIAENDAKNKNKRTGQIFVRMACLHDFKLQSIEFSAEDLDHKLSNVVVNIRQVASLEPFLILAVLKLCRRDEACEQLYRSGTNTRGSCPQENRRTEVGQESRKRKGENKNQTNPSPCPRCCPRSKARRHNSVRTINARLQNREKKGERHKNGRRHETKAQTLDFARRNFCAVDAVEDQHEGLLFRARLLGKNTIRLFEYLP